MPLYCYVCPKCEATRQEIKRMADSATPETCACGATMKRDINVEHVGSLNQEWRTLYSEALGVNPKQVAEHRRRHPDIQLTDDGRVVINSLAEQKRITKKLGMIDKNAYVS